MKLTKSKLKQMIKEELSKVLSEGGFVGLDPSKQHVFKKLKSGHWGKVSRSEDDDGKLKTIEGDLVIKPNTRGFPYGSSKDDAEERQELLNNMPKD